MRDLIRERWGVKLSGVSVGRLVEPVPDEMVEMGKVGIRRERDAAAVAVETVLGVDEVTTVRQQPLDAVVEGAALLPGGEVVVAEAGVRLTAAGPDGASETGDEAYVMQVPVTAFPLTVRNRRPGDRR